VTPATVPRVLLIGYGNPLRQDDGAGWAVAEAISRHWRHQIKVVTGQQLVPEWAFDLADADLAFLVDAAIDPDAPMVDPDQPERSLHGSGECGGRHDWAGGISRYEEVSGVDHAGGLHCHLAKTDSVGWSRPGVRIPEKDSAVGGQGHPKITKSTGDQGEELGPAQPLGVESSIPPRYHVRCQQLHLPSGAVVGSATTPGTTEAASVAGVTQVGGHAIGPDTILALARLLCGRAPQTFLVSIPAIWFGYGDDLSPVAESGIAEAVELIDVLLNRHLVE
jgi:Ni,Fe-hydrogenase maturation factor